MCAWAHVHVCAMCVHVCACGVRLGTCTRVCNVCVHMCACGVCLDGHDVAVCSCGHMVAGSDRCECVYMRAYARPHLEPAGGPPPGGVLPLSGLTLWDPRSPRPWDADNLAPPYLGSSAGPWPRLVALGLLLGSGRGALRLPGPHALLLCSALNRGPFPSHSGTTRLSGPCLAPPSTLLNVFLIRSFKL